VLALPQDQPVLLLAVEPRGDERPDAVEALPVQANGQPAVPLLLEELVAATVPDLDRPGAVLALRDLPFETCVLQRMVLDVDGEMLLARLERHTLGNRPRRERSVALEPEVVVEPAGVVPLDDEDRLPCAAAAALERLGRPSGVALAPVLLEAHRGNF